MATKSMRTYKPDDLLEMPLPPGVKGFELVDGLPVEVTPVGLAHGVVAGEVFARIRDHVKTNHVSGRAGVEIGYVLNLRGDAQRLRAPDVSFLTAESLDRMGGSAPGFVHGPPDLAVEVESPDSTRPMQRRILDYLEAGTRVVWVLNLATRSATIYHADGSAQLLRESDALTAEPVLPGLLIPLRKLFEESA